jgi:hypothetical protein
MQLHVTVLVVLHVLVQLQAQLVVLVQLLVLVLPAKSVPISENSMISKVSVSSISSSHIKEFWRMPPPFGGSS